MEDCSFTISSRLFSMCDEKWYVSSDTVRVKADKVRVMVWIIILKKNRDDHIWTFFICSLGSKRQFNSRLRLPSEIKLRIANEIWLLNTDIALSFFY
jgi:hypothetical protein